MQEVGFESGTPGNVLEYLCESIQVRIFEGVTFEDERRHYGNAVLSRLPVAGIHLHDISVAGREPRNPIQLNLHVNSAVVQITATYLGLSPAERRQQVEQLTALLAASNADINVLLGDLNEWFLWGRPLRRLRRVFDCTPAPATFPVQWPWLALDRLLVQPTSVIASLRVHKSTAARLASGHLPLIAELHPV